MSNPIFNLMQPSPAPQNMMSQLMSFARSIQGNPEQIVRGLLSSGRMSQQQFEQFAQTARSWFPNKR